MLGNPKNLKDPVQNRMSKPFPVDIGEMVNSLYCNVLLNN